MGFADQHLVDELYGVHDVPLPRDVSGFLCFLFQELYNIHCLFLFSRWCKLGVQVWIETCLFLLFGMGGLVLFVGSFKPAVKRADDVPERYVPQKKEKSH